MEDHVIKAVLRGYKPKFTVCDGYVKFRWPLNKLMKVGVEQRLDSANIKHYIWVNHQLLEIK